jgi:hypothetical protein
LIPGDAEGRDAEVGQLPEQTNQIEMCQGTRCRRLRHCGATTPPGEQVLAH